MSGSGYGNFNSAYPKLPKQEKELATHYEFSKPIGTLDDFRETLRNKRIVVVKAWANWCQPCKVFGPKMEDLGKQLEAYIKTHHLCFLNEDIDDEESIHREKLEVVPTFFIYNKGKLEQVFTGVDFDAFQQYLYQALQQES